MVAPRIVPFYICGVLFLIDWGIINMKINGLLNLLATLSLVTSITSVPSNVISDTKAEAFNNTVYCEVNEDLASVTKQDILDDLNSKYISGEIPMPLGTALIGSPENTVYFVNSYYKVPKYLRDKVRNNGFTVYLTTENIGKTELGSNKSIAGLTSWFIGTDGSKLDGYIKISDRVNAINISLIHEMGHAIDFCSDRKYSSELEYIRLIEANSFKTLSNVNVSDTSSYTEYFAECLQQYFKNNSNFKNACPRSYNYIDNVVSNLR